MIRPFYFHKRTLILIDNYRYLYVGNILDGLNQYITLMQNIKQRENRRNIR